MRCGFPRGLLGMIGLVAVVEIFLARQPLVLRSPDSWTWNHSGREARRAARGCAVLAFGDSLMKCGIAPRVLEARLGRRVYNLAVGGGTAPASYFLLRQALDSGARPAAVLVDFPAETLPLEPERWTRLWPEFAGLRESWDLACSARD